MIVKHDCRFFRGDSPCKLNKEFGCHCENCNYYKKVKGKILIIKLGAIGDVIRTTPIIRRLKSEFPETAIFWISYFPEILSQEWVDRILSPSLESIELIKQIEFDWLINLDKDPLAISLTHQISAKRKSGFTMDEFGKAKPISSNAEEHKWLTGIFDDISKENTKHYLQEIFEILGYQFAGEEYILEAAEHHEWKLDYSKKIIGLNTGCGGRWTSRLWPDEYWIELAKELIQDGKEVILLGGAQEHDKNYSISKKTGAKYFGHFSLNKFISLVNKCDIVVTAVTMAMHIAMGLRKKTIIFNNIFNKNEFYLYGRGEIIEPNPKCECYYSPTCSHDSMKKIVPQSVFQVILSQLKP